MFTQTVYPDYYTSKAYRKGKKGYDIVPVKEALKLGADKLEKHYRVTNLSQVQTNLLQRAIDNNASIINYATWNDFPEGHHLAPEEARGFGPSLLLRHFKAQWQDPADEVDEDIAVVFYKRYRHDAKPTHEISLKIDSKNQDLASEDRIELVTMLKSPANIRLNHHGLGEVAAGFQVHSIPSIPGIISVHGTRDGKPIFQFSSTRGVLSHPHRTDRLTYSISNLDRQEMEKLFK